MVEEGLIVFLDGGLLKLFLTRLVELVGRLAIFAHEPDQRVGQHLCAFRLGISCASACASMLTR